MKVVNSLFGDQKVILTLPFGATKSNRNFRSFHSHNCIEMSYVLAGHAEHIFAFPDGKIERKKISRGNYVIVDSQVSHAYRNGTDDFTVINLLFKTDFFLNSNNNSVGLSFPSALSVTRTEWHDNKEANGIEIAIELKKTQQITDEKYIRIWLDLSGESTELDFSEARVGLITNDNISDPYLICGPEKVPFYYIDEHNKLIKMYHGKDGYFGANNGSSVKGFKGWFAFPLDRMYQKSTGKILTKNDDITGAYFYYAISDKSMAKNYLHIDDITLVEDYFGPTRFVLGQSNLIDFDNCLFKIVSTAENGNIAPEVYPEQIVVSIPENDIYNLVKEEYKEFDYEKIPLTTINGVYYDKYGSLQSLFKVCYDSSREQWYEWQRIVKNSLSLIVMLSLQSMLDLNDEKKENIIDTVKDYINVHYAENITLTEICEKYFYNVSYVSRKFKEVNNCSFEQYLRSVRIERACEMLVSTSKSVFEIAESCGYSSTRSFRKAFSFVTGKTPTKFRKM